MDEPRLVAGTCYGHKPIGEVLRAVLADDLDILAVELNALTSGVDEVTILVCPGASVLRAENAVQMCTMRTMMTVFLANTLTYVVREDSLDGEIAEAEWRLTGAKVVS
jgi:hypothetical protein